MQLVKTVAWVAFFAVIGLFGGGVIKLNRDRPPEGNFEGKVVKVVDGDTVRVKTDDGLITVRYVGVDTPESKRPNTPVQCFALAAASYNRKLVLNRSVVVKRALDPQDRYGRALGYVFRKDDNLFINRELIRKGYAKTLVIEPNTAYKNLLENQQQRAQKQQLGLWKQCD